MTEARVARNETQWLSMKEWFDDKHTKWGDCQKDKALLGTGIMDITAKVQAKTCVGEAALA